MNDDEELTVSITAFRARMAETIDRAETTGDPVHLTRNGKRVVTMIRSDHFENLMERAESWQDAVAAADAVAEGGPNLTWEEVARDLGWDEVPSGVVSR